MLQTDGSVPRTAATFLRRPLRLSPDAATSGHPKPAATPGSLGHPADPATPDNGTAAERRPGHAPRRPLTPGLNESGHQSVGGDDADAPARPTTHLSKAQILEATAVCLAEKGYDRTTIRAIAQRLDCAVGSIYRYYTDKRELLGAVVQHRFLPVAEAVEAGENPDATARQYLAAARSGTEQYRLMFWLTAVGRTPDQPAVLPEVIERILAGWTEQLGDANAARCRWALLHGQVMLGHDLACDSHLPGFDRIVTDEARQPVHAELS